MSAFIKLSKPPSDQYVFPSLDETVSHTHTLKKSGSLIAYAGGSSPSYDQKRRISINILLSVTSYKNMPGLRSTP